MLSLKPWKLVLSMAGAGGLLAGWVGWWSPVQDWRAATGWVRIPSSERPLAAPLWDAGAVGEAPPEISWLGHSGFVIEWHGRRIVLDPVTSSWCMVSRRVLPPPAAVPGPVDAALISHAHYDHLDLPTLRSLPGLATVVVPAASEGYVAGLAAKAVGLAPGDSWRLGDLEIVAVEAAHNGNRFHPLKSRQLAVGYVIQSPHNAVYYAGDTGFGDHFAAVRDRYRPRAAILPIGGYLPRVPLKHYHLSPEDAVKAAGVLEVETVLPCHFGTFTLALDRPSWALPRFARAARAAGLSWRMPRLLGDGG